MANEQVSQKSEKTLEGNVSSGIKEGEIDRALELGDVGRVKGWTTLWGKTGKDRDGIECQERLGAERTCLRKALEGRGAERRKQWNKHLLKHLDNQQDKQAPAGESDNPEEQTQRKGKTVKNAYQVIKNRREKKI